MREVSPHIPSMENESEMKPMKAIRTLAMTPKGKEAIADMPELTWDQVMDRAEIGSCNPCELGRPTKR
jgi:hypothetical protein